MLKKALFPRKWRETRKYTKFNIKQNALNQRIIKKLQKANKKKQKKRYNLLKKCVPLQRFKKIMIVLQIKKSKEKMKKLVFMFVAIAAISFASCGNKTAQAPAEDTTAVDTAVVDTTVADTAAVDTAAAL